MLVFMHSLPLWVDHGPVKRTVHSRYQSETQHAESFRPCSSHEPSAPATGRTFKQYVSSLFLDLVFVDLTLACRLVFRVAPEFISDRRSIGLRGWLRRLGLVPGRFQLVVLSSPQIRIIYPLPFRSSVSNCDFGDILVSVITRGWPHQTNWVLFLMHG